LSERLDLGRGKLGQYTLAQIREETAKSGDQHSSNSPADARNETGHSASPHSLGTGLNLIFSQKPGQNPGANPDYEKAQCGQASAQREGDGDKANQQYHQ